MILLSNLWIEQLAAMADVLDKLHNAMRLVVYPSLMWGLYIPGGERFISYEQ